MRKESKKMKNRIKNFIIAFMVLWSVMSLVSCVETDDDKKEIVGQSETLSEGKLSNDSSNNTTNKKVSIVEQKCFEYDGLVVNAKEFVDDMFMGSGIKFYLENNSSKNYTVGIESVIVNNCMSTGLFSCQVDSGKKANETLYFSSSDLKAAGINVIGHVEVYFYVYDPETFDRIFESECVSIKTSHYNDMDMYNDKNGHTLYDSEGIKIIGKYVDENTFWGSSVLLYIENNTDKKISISCDNVSVNGYMISSLFYSTVYQNKYALDDISLLSSDLEANGITDINEIELKFKIIDSETYNTITETDSIKFNTK